MTNTKLNNLHKAIESDVFWDFRNKFKDSHHIHTIGETLETVVLNYFEEGEDLQEFLESLIVLYSDNPTYQIGEVVINASDKYQDMFIDKDFLNNIPTQYESYFDFERYTEDHIKQNEKVLDYAQDSFENFEVIIMTY